VIEAIQCAAKTGHTGDGVILVQPLEGFVRIRTGASVPGSEPRQAPSRMGQHSSQETPRPFARRMMNAVP
jgi:hypothetical protein